MTVDALAEALQLQQIVVCDGGRRVTGGYTGDLLSWVMGRAQMGEVWVTIMSNSNIIAVATLVDVACIVLAEGVQPDVGVMEAARARGINLLGSEASAFALCAQVTQLL
ncbi:MAG: hypothetical protein RRZ24_05345 [Clostridia bacterium]